MTAVIIQFQPTLTEKFQSKDKCADEVITSKKRQASPPTSNDELTTSSKKLIQLEKLLRYRGTDFDLWLHYHNIHKDFEQQVADSFREFGIDVKLVNRYSNIFRSI